MLLSVRSMPKPFLSGSTWTWSSLSARPSRNLLGTRDIDANICESVHRRITSCSPSWSRMSGLNRLPSTASTE